MPTATAPSPRVSPFRPFRHPIFRWVWITSTISNFGGLIEGVGAAWMMVTLAAPASMVALVQASRTLPVMLLSLTAKAMSVKGRKLLSPIAAVAAAKAMLERRTIVSVEKRRRATLPVSAPPTAPTPNAPSSTP